MLRFGRTDFSQDIIKHSVLLVLCVWVCVHRCRVGRGPGQGEQAGEGEEVEERSHGEWRGAGSSAVRGERGTMGGLGHRRAL